MTAGFTLEIRPEHPEIARLLDAVTAFARSHLLPDRDVSNMCIALDELLSNVITHGLAESAAHPIATAIRLESNRLVAEITDRGRPFDPFLEAPVPDLTSPAETRRVGGLGVHLVRTLMDETSYRRDGAINRTVIAKSMKLASSL